MMVSKIELEQMLKDGKGRPSVVKYLVEKELGLHQAGQEREELSFDEKEDLVKAISHMVVAWPNSLEMIFDNARMRAIASAPFKDSGTWWRSFRDQLPQAARDWLS